MIKDDSPISSSQDTLNFKTSLPDNTGKQSIARFISSVDKDQIHILTTYLTKIFTPTLY